MTRHSDRRHIGPWFGLFAAIGLVAFTAALYFGGLNIYLSGYAYFGYVIPIGLAAVATLVQRKANGGWLAFRPALQTAFTVLVLALAAQTLFTWVLFNLIDTPFRDAVGRETAIRTERFLQAGDLSPDDLKKYMEYLRNSHPFTLGSMILGLCVSCIVQFIVALLIAAVVKKKKEE
jgi:hypothetical protein